MQTRVLVRPADETVEPTLTVKGVQALAVEVFFLHLADDANGLLPHGRDSIADAVTRYERLRSG